jgi:hypothetical protein
MAKEGWISGRVKILEWTSLCVEIAKDNKCALLCLEALVRDRLISLLAN